MSDPDRYAVIGQPVSHSRSPFIHERFARQTGQLLTYSRIEASPAQFAGAVRGFFAGGGKGLNVTVPHKEVALLLAAELTPRAMLAAAVNTLTARADGSLLGDNTDGEGLVRDLTLNLGLAVTGKRLLLLGAGGAARGVLAPLLELRPAELLVANRSVERAEGLARRFARLGNLRACGFDAVADALGASPLDLVINATSASLAGEVPPLSAGCIGADTFCYDMAYGADETPFVRWSRAAGAKRTAMGLGMLVEQAAASFLLWRGVRPETASVLAELTVALRN